MADQPTQPLPSEPFLPVPSFPTAAESVYADTAVSASWEAVDGEQVAMLNVGRHRFQLTREAAVKLSRLLQATVARKKSPKWD